jgi:toxin ParE1/3/4
VTRYVLSPRAQADIDDIWTYTVKRWSVDQAERYLRLLQTEIGDLASDPLRGRACDEIRPGYRKGRAGSHVIFYRVDDYRINIVRILHQSMDFERHL